MSVSSRGGLGGLAAAAAAAAAQKGRVGAWTCRRGARPSRPAVSTRRATWGDATPARELARRSSLSHANSRGWTKRWHARWSGTTETDGRRASATRTKRTKRRVRSVRGPFACGEPSRGPARPPENRRIRRAAGPVLGNPTAACGLAGWRGVDARVARTGQRDVAGDSNLIFRVLLLSGSLLDVVCCCPRLRVVVRSRRCAVVLPVVAAAAVVAAATLRRRSGRRSQVEGRTPPSRCPRRPRCPRCRRCRRRLDASPPRCLDASTPRRASMPSRRGQGQSWPARPLAAETPRPPPAARRPPTGFTAHRPARLGSVKPRSWEAGAGARKPRWEARTGSQACAG